MTEPVGISKTLTRWQAVVGLVVSLGGVAIPMGASLWRASLRIEQLSWRIEQNERVEVERERDRKATADAITQAAVRAERIETKVDLLLRRIP